MKLLIITFSVLYCLSSVSFGQEKIYLDGVYATSTALPYDDYGVANLFDNDLKTNWQTVRGAGPDEGIMIYFQEPVYVEKIDMSYVQGEGFADVSQAEIYADGRSFWTRTRLQQEVTSVYIRFSGVSNTTVVKKDINGTQFRKANFDPAMAIGISEINITGYDDIPYELIAPVYVKGSLSASSSLNPALAYGVENLMDCKREFGWAEGNKGKGAGEQIRFDFDTEIKISAIRLWNGYQRSPKHFASNARVKKISFSKTGEEFPPEYTVYDHDGIQTIKLAYPLMAKSFEMKIKEVFPGTAYDDLVISELHLMHEGQTILAKGNLTESRVKENLANTHKILNTIMDRRVSVTTNKLTQEGDSREYASQRNSLIIRSNHSFVLYQNKNSGFESNEGYGEDSKETIADGNWELKESGEGFVKIKIFGKIYSPVTSADLYKGEVSDNNVRIFNDLLTITADKITGQKFIEDIILQ